MNRLFEHIKEQADRYPDRPAVCDASESITYRQLILRIEEFCRQLRSLRIHAGSRVLLPANNSADLLALIIALIREQVNLFLLDPRSTEAERQDILRDIPVHFIITEYSAGDAGPDLPGKLQVHHRVFHVAACDLKSETTLPAKLYFFSSGSTGIPKAFGFTDEQLTQKMQCLAAFMQFHPDDSSLVPLTVTHSHGLMLSLPLLLSGGCVYYLLPGKSMPEDILRAVEKNRITILTGVPYQYNLILQYQDGHPDALRSLRFAFCGSAPMSEYLAMTFEEKFGIRLNPAYGVSEIGPVCICLHETNACYFRSVGKVLPYIEYRIINEQGESVSAGEEGELIVRSGYMSDSYINAPEDSVQTFRDGWIYTQDIVREDEKGYIYILGRKKNFINVSGYKVYPVEVEKVLLSMRGIKDAAVFGIPDEARGQNIKAVVSVFQDIPEPEIRAFCRKYLASYKVPHHIVIETELQHGSINKVSYAKYSGSSSE